MAAQQEMQEKANRAGITWDEEVIAEHDKLRGTRMKIDEPDTPFAYGGMYGEDVEEGMTESEVTPEGEFGPKPPEAAPPPANAKSPPASLESQFASLEQKLGQAAEAQNVGELKVGAERVEEEQNAQSKKEAFKAKRAAHYNEFERVKAMRAQGLLDDEDDEGE